MPYINAPRRIELSNNDQAPENAGELNYLISCLLVDYWNDNKQNYQTINDMMGALEGAKMEFYRRVAVPYENKKIFDNGDIY